jgi:hypothetical protein
MTEPRRRGDLLTLAAIVVVCVPALVLAYLPMTDLPQHLAVASILDHGGDPAYGFGDWYVVDWLRTPYVLPYALAIAFGKVVGLAGGMRIVVFLSLVVYPLGVMAILRAADKPAWLALLALPFVYNRTFFWGFVAFDLSIGLALLAFALYVSPRVSIRRDVALAAAVLGTTLSHIYGLALVIALVVAYAVVGGWPRLRARPWRFAPLAVGVLLWVLGAREQQGYGITISPPLGERLVELPHELLGGYADRSELVVLVLFVAAWLPLVRVRRLSVVERVAWLCAAGNLVAYFVLPQATFTAKFIHFRHAFLAASLLPIVARPPERFLLRALPVVLAGVVAVNSWAHLVLFDREARRFDRIVDAVPPKARIVSIIFERDGDVMRTDPYLHFAGYAQAAKGGLLAMTFPATFWNLPVTMKPGLAIPETPINAEWNPNLYSDRAFGHFYDYALVRIPVERALAATDNFPFELVAAAPPWQLYRRISK